jgi:hypothetical protein
LIGFIGTTKVVPCYKAKAFQVFQQVPRPGSGAMVEWMEAAGSVRDAVGVPVFRSYEFAMWFCELFAMGGKASVAVKGE